MNPLPLIRRALAALIDAAGAAPPIDPATRGPAHAFSPVPTANGCTCGASLRGGRAHSTGCGARA